MYGINKGQERVKLALMMIAKRDIASINAVSVIHQRTICEKQIRAFENC
jgi:hypothetical protein